MGRVGAAKALLLAAGCAFSSACVPPTEVVVARDYEKARGKISLVEPATRPGDYLIPFKIYAEWLRRGPSYFIRQISVTPIVEDKEFIGFRLDSVFENHVLFTPGEIRQGDVVQSINGLPIGRPEQFMKVWEGLKSQRSLQLRVLRNGQALGLTWAIVGENQDPVLPAALPEKAKVGLGR